MHKTTGYNHQHDVPRGDKAPLDLSRTLLTIVLENIPTLNIFSFWQELHSVIPDNTQPTAHSLSAQGKANNYGTCTN